MPKLSIVILNYNTEDLLKNCLGSLEGVRNECDFEVIVVDNASSDGSVPMIKKDFGWVHVIENKENSGFAKGNNLARTKVKGSYVLILNSDTEVPKGTLQGCLKYLEDNTDVGVVTCKTVLPSGKLDRDARRSFPTPWVSLTHFSGLDKVFPKSRHFARYWYGYMDSDVIHDVEVVQGAFCMARREVLDEVGWYDERYFLDGEDIDLCWKIKEAGHRIVYNPEFTVKHIKKGTKGKLRSLVFVMAGVESMEIFYRTRLWKRYPFFINFLVIVGIKIIRTIRYFNLLFFSS